MKLYLGIGKSNLLKDRIIWGFTVCGDATFIIIIGVINNQRPCKEKQGSHLAELFFRGTANPSTKEHFFANLLLFYYYQELTKLNEVNTRVK